MKQNLRSALGASIGMFACIALAVPGQASTKEANTSRANVVSAKSSSEAAKPKTGAKQHCMTIEALTGSRMPQRKCKTIAQWEALGFEFKSER